MSLPMIALAKVYKNSETACTDAKKACELLRPYEYRVAQREYSQSFAAYSIFLTLSLIHI